MPAVPRQTLDVIFGHVQAGRIDEAEILCRRTLDSAPDDINVLGMLGAILLKKGELDEAQSLLERTIELEPAFAKPHEDLGWLHLKRGDAESALRCFESAVSLDATQAATVAGLAEALQRLGRAADAEQARRRFVELSPTAQLLAEAEALRRAGETARAEEICQDVVKREPGNTSALRILAIIASDDERFVIAEGLLRRIVKIAPENAGARRDLGRFLADRTRCSEAIVHLRKAAELEPGNAAVQLALADVLSIIGRTAEALHAYERCLEKEPDNLAALTGSGHMLRFAGRRDEAVTSYRKVTELKPDYGDAWWNLAAMHGFEATDKDVEAMRRELNSEETTGESEIGLHFALARALEARGDFDGAWREYELGNAKKRASIKYDPVESEVTHDRLQEVFSAELMSQPQHQIRQVATPIFIVGMPRSGSTLVEQILSSHSTVEGCGELPYVVMLTTALGRNRADSLRYPEVVAEFGESEFEGSGRTYLHHSKTHRTLDTPYFTDKMPSNFSHAGFIRLMLPQAKIIDARRHPLATCVANYRQLFAQGKNQSYDLTELGEYYLLYDRIMRHWDEVMPGAVLRIEYEDVVADLDSAVRRILDFCGLPFEQGCIDFHRSRRPVNTASAEQVRQPIYDSGVEFWKHYDKHLGELKEILAPIL